MVGNSHRAYFTGCLRFALGMTFYPKERIFFLPVSIFIFKKKCANNKQQLNRTFVVIFFNYHMQLCNHISVKFKIFYLTENNLWRISGSALILS